MGLTLDGEVQYIDWVRGVLLLKVRYTDWVRGVLLLMVRYIDWVRGSYS